MPYKEDTRAIQGVEVTLIGTVAGMERMDFLFDS